MPEGAPWAKAPSSPVLDDAVFRLVAVEATSLPWTAIAQFTVLAFTVLAIAMTMVYKVGVEHGKRTTETYQPMLG